MSKSSRKIQCYGNSITKDELFFHPITLKLVKNISNKNICPSQLNKAASGEYEYDMISNTNLDKKSLQRFMSLPYLDFHIDMMLDIYNITDSDSMISFINKMIEEKKEFNTINRIFNLWINKNFEDLENNHNIVIMITKKLLKYNNIEVNDLDKRINKWFKNKDINDFLFNLISELEI